MNETVDKSPINFQNLFESAPDLYLLLSPGLVIIGASNAYLNATMTSRDDIMGCDLFDVFPDNPDDITANGVSNLYASLISVLQKKGPDKMAIQRYDIRRPDGTFEERFWSPLNTPVFNENNEITFIIHRVEDVTEQERMKREMSKFIKRKEELEASERHYIMNLKASEDRFIKIFNYSPTAIIITDAIEGKIMHVNNAFEKLFLFRKHDIIGKTMTGLQMTDEISRDTMAGRIRQKGGHSVEMEVDLKDAAGNTKKILTSTEIVEIDNTVCFMKVMIDISQRKVIEESLKQTNHFLDTILENIPNMVFVKDARELKFLRFNKAGEDILGYSREDLVGKNDYDFFAREQADFFVEKDKEVINNSKLVNIEEEPIRTARGERWLHTRKIPVYENGKPVYLIGISEDITERKKQQDAILLLNKELEAFSYSVSHDLRAPLRAIAGFAKILEEDYETVFDDEGKRLLGIISRNAEKMGGLIDDLLNFSRLGRKELAIKDTDMNTLVNNVLKDINRPDVIVPEIKIGELYTVKSDAALMSQVWGNLIGNAIKYSSKKDMPLIEIAAVQKENEIVYSVKDNGAGFDMRYADKLFGVFQRLHTAAEFEGTGVGLAIVHRIINKHGGRAWAEGKIGEGATIYFSLPTTNQ